MAGWKTESRRKQRQEEKKGRKEQIGTNRKQATQEDHQKGKYKTKK